MIAMDKVHSIRQLFYEQGKSVSAIAAETGHDRKTISKYGYYGAAGSSANIRFLPLNIVMHIV